MLATRHLFVPPKRPVFVRLSRGWREGLRLVETLPAERWALLNRQIDLGAHRWMWKTEDVGQAPGRLRTYREFREDGPHYLKYWEPGDEVV